MRYQRMRDDEHRVGDEGQGGSQREPLKDPLLRVRDIVVGGPFDEVARGIGCGERLAPRARSGWFGDISIRIRGGDAADSEGRQEEEEHEDGVRIVEDRRCFAH